MVGSDAALAKLIYIQLHSCLFAGYSAGGAMVQKRNKKEALWEGREGESYFQSLVSYPRGNKVFSLSLFLSCIHLSLFLFLSCFHLTLPMPFSDALGHILEKERE